eukprot:7039587-Pyramimonas_sp.AAC.1
MSVAVGCQGPLQPRRDLEGVLLIASFRLQAQVEKLARCPERDALQRDAFIKLFSMWRRIKRCKLDSPLALAIASPFSSLRHDKATCNSGVF